MEGDTDREFPRVKIKGNLLERARAQSLLGK